MWINDREIFYFKSERNSWFVSEERSLIFIILMVGDIDDSFSCNSCVEHISKVVLELLLAGLGITDEISFLEIVELHDIDLSLSKDSDG